MSSEWHRRFPSGRGLVDASRIQHTPYMAYQVLHSTAHLPSAIARLCPVAVTALLLLPPVVRSTEYLVAQLPLRTE